jgi:hypothetical protein
MTTQTIATRTFHGGAIRAEIEPNEDREGVQCWLYAARKRTRYGQPVSSLAVVEDHGRINPDEDGETPVPDAVIEAVRTWAERHGY